MLDMSQRSFDYTTLDDSKRLFLQMKAQAIKTRMKSSAKDIIAIGQDLIQVKETLGHGQFLVWIKAEFDMTEMSYAS